LPLIIIYKYALVFKKGGRKAYKLSIIIESSETMLYVCSNHTIMQLEEAKLEFVQTWGVLGSSWGIPKSMAQIHALLLSTNEGLSAEDIMSTIHLSRGNVNINLRELITWGLVSKKSKLGERKEFFEAQHDIWTMAKNIMEERKKREFGPVQEILSKLQQAEISGNEKDVEHFKMIINELHDFVNQMDQLSSLMVKMNNNLFFKKMIKSMSKKK